MHTLIRKDNRSRLFTFLYVQTLHHQISDWGLIQYSLLSEHLIRSISSRLCQDKLKRLELELDEEKNSVEMLTDRVARSRDQIDQLRSELMQERSSKQDLELDKNAMERHVHIYTQTHPHSTPVFADHH